MATKTDVCEPNGLIGSAQRALRVLEVVAAEGDGATAKIVARRSGYTLGTTYHLLNTLVHENYLVRVGGGGGFGLGYKVADLFTLLRNELDPGHAVRAELAALHRETGAVVCYTVFRHQSIVVAATAGAHTPRADIGVGDAPHTTAFGKVLLASLSARDRLAYLDSRPAAGALTLHAELNQVRRTGLADEVGEFRPDLACIAAPVPGDRGRTAGAVALCVPVAVFGPGRPRLATAARAGADRIATALNG